MLNHGTSSVVQGWFMEFVGAVIRQLPRDINPTTADGWINNQDALKKALREVLSPNEKPVVNAYSAVVDYGKSVEEMVKLGRYDWSSNNITSEHFPTKRIGKTEIVVDLVHFNRRIGTDEALKELDRMGYRPAELYELLAFGEKYPEIQRGFPVIALGSVWRSSGGNRYVPCLGGSGFRRYLDLHWIEGGWGGLYRFAAVRK